MFKITSRFYIIYGNSKPIYVGYTNRTVKQRFSEHCKDKDFSGYDNIHVKELTDEKLSFSFTWDYEQTCSNANEVSERESHLVSKYGTQNTIYQKAIGGGQTWATEKYFVLTNRDNPKFKGMKPTDVKKIILSRKAEQVWLNNFTSDIQPIEQAWLKNFISYIQPADKVWLKNFISHIQPADKVWLGSFISNIQPMEKVWLKNFISYIQPMEKAWLNSFIHHIQPADKVWLNIFISHIQPADKVWLGSFISNIQPMDKVWLGNFIYGIQPMEKAWLNSFIHHIQPADKVWLNNFISNIIH